MRGAIILVGVIAICVLASARSAHAQGAYGTQDDYGTGNLASREHFRLGELIGKTVRNRQGQTLGTVEDVIASETGRISYLLLSMDGALGLTERWAPVPWQAAGARVMRNQPVLDVSKDRLENAPSFSKGSLPDFSQQRVQSRINSYYEMDQVGEQDRYRSEERRYPSREEERRSEPFEFEEEENGRFGEYESYRHNGETDFERDDEYEYGDRDYEDRGRYDERSDEPRDRNRVYPY